MAFAAVVALATLQDLVAEKAAWGGPEWTVGGCTTAGAAVATIAGATNASSVKVQHYLDYLSVSLSAVASTAAAIQVKDGTTVIWEEQIGIGFLRNNWDFSHRPLRCTAGALLSAGLTGSNGASIIQQVTIGGHSNVPSTPA